MTWLFFMPECWTHLMMKTDSVIVALVKHNKKHFAKFHVILKNLVQIVLQLGGCDAQLINCIGVTTL